MFVRAPLPSAALSARNRSLAVAASQHATADQDFIDAVSETLEE
jgi:hypothetical protein